MCADILVVVVVGGWLVDFDVIVATLIDIVHRVASHSDLYICYNGNV